MKRKIKNGKALITVFTKEPRLIDRICMFALKKRMFDYTGFYPIYDKDHKDVGRIYCAYGNNLLIKFLSCASDYRGIDGKAHEIEWK